MTGAELTAARKAAGISLRSLAAHLQIAPSYLCDLEYGRRSGEKAQEQIARAMDALKERAAKRWQRTKGTTP